MAVELHNLKPAHKSKSRKRVGRGGKRGTYSGRGMKGQRSRSGGRSGLKRLGLKTLMTQTHKLRGFKSPHARVATVNLSDLEKNYKDGQIVTPLTLKKKGMIATTQHGVKILGGGKLTKKLTVKNCQVSKTAAEKLNISLPSEK